MGGRGQKAGPAQVAAEKGRRAAVGRHGSQVGLRKHLQIRRGGGICVSCAEAASFSSGGRRARRTEDSGIGEVQRRV